jgi:hypothetical protein
MNDIPTPILKLINQINELTNHGPGNGSEGVYGTFGILREENHYTAFRLEDRDSPYFITTGLSESAMIEFLVSLVHVYGFEHGGIAEILTEY